MSQKSASERIVHLPLTVATSSAWKPKSCKASRLVRIRRKCDPCKERKVRCSGDEPCNHCRRRRETCYYRAPESRVLVSKEYLRALERHSTANETFPQAGIDSLEYQREHHVEAYSVEIGSHNRAPRLTLDSSRRLALEQEQEQGPQPQSRPHSQSHKVSEQASENSSRNRQEPQHSSPVGEGLGGPQDYRSHSLEVDPTLKTNPLLGGSSMSRDAEGRSRFLGPSSTWSFTRRVIPLIEKYSPDHNTPPFPTNTDGTAYKLRWSRLPESETPDLSDLPARDYAIYIFNTFTFHIGQLFLLIDEEAFLKDLDLFYNDPHAKVRESRIWYAEFLFVLAFGKAFLAPGNNTSSPAGSNYAIRALSLIPDFADTHVEGSLEIEVNCLAALYLQSLDMRITAYQYIGQALRLCYIEGIHRDWPEEEYGSKRSKRCSNTWWTVYVLDQELSALMGAPSCIIEKDITARLPSDWDASIRATCSGLHIRLSRLTARILNTVYGAGQQSGSSFLSDTRDVLRNLADISKEADEAITTRTQSSIGGFSRLSTHITISYHHCIVLAARPLVMWILQKYLESVASPGGPCEQSLAASIVSLLQTCVDSATAILKLLRALATNDLLDSFLPFHLEGAFSSAFVLSILHVTCPRRFHDKTWEIAIHSVLETMIRNGSAPAKLRQAELNHLSDLLSSLIDAWNSPSQMQQTPSAAPIDGYEANVVTNAEPALVSDLQDSWTWESIDPFFSTGIMGVAHDDMLQLADQLSIEDFCLSL